MRVVQYSTSLDQSSGGTAAYVQLLANELGKIVDLHIITHRVDNPLPMENCTVHEVINYNHFSQFKKECKALLNELKPDVVHVNLGWFPGGSLFLFLAKKMGYKVALQTHGMLEPWEFKKNYWTKKLPALLLYMRKAVKKADMLLATSSQEKENLLKLGYNKCVGQLPNGVDVKSIKMKTSWTKSQTVFFLALLRPNKGAEFVIRAVKELKPKMEGYKVIIAGKGEDNYVNQLKQMASEAGVDDIVDFVGPIFGEQKWELYRKADFFILPTLNENFGIVIAESLASGTPVITCKGAPWKEIEEYKCGWWAERTDEDICKSIEEALSLNQAQLEQMGCRGRRLVEEKYSSRNVAETILGLYESIIEK